MSDWRMIAADALLVAGSLVMTLSVKGFVTFSDANAKIHSSTMGAVCGVWLFVVAAVVSGPLPLSIRAVILGLLVLLTAPAGAHALARAVWLGRTSERTPEELADGSAHSEANADESL